MNNSSNEATPALEQLPKELGATISTELSSVSGTVNNSIQDVPASVSSGSGEFVGEATVNIAAETQTAALIATSGDVAAPTIPTSTDSGVGNIGTVDPDPFVDGSKVIPNPFGDASKEVITNVADVSSETIDVSKEVLLNVGDVSLHSLGLGSWSTPIGVIQNVLDTMHTTVGLPWWGSIVCCTVVFRFMVLPLAIKGIKNNMKLQAIKPEMDRLQALMKSKKAQQDPKVKGRANQELIKLFKKHDTNPLKGLITPMVQLPLFISFFLAMRRMVEAPVPSFVDGGALWFTNLTLPDQYYILPCISASIMLLTIEMGQSEFGPMYNNMKWFGRIMCLVIIPVTMRFPTALLTYWVTTNSFTCVQSYLLRQPAMKKKLGIPEPLPSAPGSDSSKNPISGLYDQIYKQAEKKYELKKFEEERKQRLLNPQTAQNLLKYDPTRQPQSKNKSKGGKRKSR